MYCLQVRNTSLDDRVGSTVRELVPAVCGSNGDFGEDLLGLLDLAEKLLAVKVATVESFGADSDGLNDIFVSRNASLEGIDILVERFIRIRPKKKVDVSGHIPPPSLRIFGNKIMKMLKKKCYSTYQTAKTTLKPLAFAAGMMFCAV